MKQLFLVTIVACLAATTDALAQPQPLPLGGVNQESNDPSRAQALLSRTPLQIRRDMKPGEVLARGNRVDANNDGIQQEGECYFDYVLAVQPGQTVSTVVGPGCTVLLHSVVEGPTVLLRPEHAPNLARMLFRRFMDAVVPRVHAQSQTRPYTQGVYGHLYHWGFGGKEFDGLTAQQGWIEWEHNAFNSAQMLHAGGWYCTAGYTYPPQGCLQMLGIPPMNKNNTGWTPLQMGWLNPFWGPSYQIGRTDWAEFGFAPNWNWRHTLTLQRVGQGNGYGYCPSSVSGSVTAGTTIQCYYYNLPWPYGYRP